MDPQPCQQYPTNVAVEELNEYVPIYGEEGFIDIPTYIQPPSSDTDSRCDCDSDSDPITIEEIKSILHQLVRDRRTRRETRRSTCLNMTGWVNWFKEPMSCWGGLKLGLVTAFVCICISQCIS